MDTKKVLSIAVPAVLMAAMFWFVLRKLPDFSTVWSHVRAMTGVEVAVLAAFAAWNLATYWIVMVAATPGLTYRQAMVVKSSAMAVSTSIPGGGAIGVGLTYSMLGSWGFSKSRATLSLTVSAIWNNFVKLGLPVLALAAVAFQGETSGSRMVAGSVGLAALVGAITLFVLVLHREHLAYRVGETAGRAASRVVAVVHRPPVGGWGDATVTFRGRMVGLVRRRWVRLTVTALVSNLSLFGVLLVTLRDIGVGPDQVSWMQALAVFAFVRLLTMVPLTPGGLGIVELGLISGLTAAGGVRTGVVAAVLVYRLLTYVAPILFGVLTYLFWRHNTSWRNTAPPLAAALVLTPA